MQIAALLAMLTLLLGATPADACFVSAAELPLLLNANRRAVSSQPGPQDLAEAMRLTGFVQGIFDDLRFRNTMLCDADEVTAGDLIALLDRHYQATLDKYDALPSQICAAELAEIVFLDRFRCSPPTKTEPPPPAR